MVNSMSTTSFSANNQSSRLLTPTRGSKSDECMFSKLAGDLRSLISPDDPTLSPGQQARKRREEFFSTRPVKVQKVIREDTPGRRMRAATQSVKDSTQSSLPPWLDDFSSKLVIKKWPKVLEYHETFAAFYEAKKRYDDIDRLLKTPEGRIFTSKLKERGPLRATLLGAHSEIMAEIYAETDPDLRDMLLEKYRLEGGDEISELQSPESSIEDYL
ncbi:hypothetical protein N7462_005608 [Penicillium macrosclerotiorum]|uniref:uncharacterized protein n=1 Tax=Penicillium macrosclerotiorum TaxID=303699 RepID=UPI0025489349|nr:uncharacterized protein N7462_005608 [Penicillium macrosclerotiorum]KAJ5682443.1 hypothetical protein N7462_005608 [Penicillium macrosclerotiorum]